LLVEDQLVGWHTQIIGVRDFATMTYFAGEELQMKKRRQYQLEAQKAVRVNCPNGGYDLHRRIQ
jgi:hypothetical protein